MDRQWGHWRDQRVGLLQVTVKAGRSVSSLVVCYGVLRISKFDWACSIMGPIWAEENAMDNAATAAEHERLILKRKVRGVKPSDPENSLRRNSWHGVVKIYGSNRAHVWLMYIGAFRLLTLNLLDNARLCTCLLITLPANQWCTCQHSGLAIVDRSLSEAWDSTGTGGIWRKSKEEHEEHKFPPKACDSSNMRIRSPSGTAIRNSTAAKIMQCVEREREKEPNIVMFFQISHPVLAGHVQT